MKRRILIILPLIIAFFAVSCNKETTYTIKLQNGTAQAMRISVKLDQSLAAPGQNTLKFDKIVLGGQFVEVYYNQGLGIKAPVMPDNDTLLQYEVDVIREDSVPCTRNFRSLRSYLDKSDAKKKNFFYDGVIVTTDFP